MNEKTVNCWENIPDNLEDYLGFVYMVTNRETQEYYIGQKKFWTFKRLKPLKGKKRGRKVRVESNWRTYNTSSGKLKDADLNDPEKFEKAIISCHKSKSMMNLVEFDYIYHDLVILPDSKCLNRMLNIRLNIDKLKSE